MQLVAQTENGDTFCEGWHPAHVHREHTTEHDDSGSDQRRYHGGDPLAPNMTSPFTHALQLYAERYQAQVQQHRRYVI